MFAIWRRNNNSRAAGIEQLTRRQMSYLRGFQQCRASGKTKQWQRSCRHKYFSSGVVVTEASVLPRVSSWLFSALTEILLLVSVAEEFQK